MEWSAEGDRSVEMVSGDSSGGMYDISGLSAATRYTVEVAAVNSAGIGVYSDAVMFETRESKCVYLQLYTVCIQYDVQNNGCSTNFFCAFS